MTSFGPLKNPHMKKIRKKTESTITGSCNSILESSKKRVPLAEQFARLVEESRRDPHIIALWLDGSRGKEVKVTEHSDYDIGMIVTVDTLDIYRTKYEHSDLDLGVMALKDFETYADYGTREEWDRYNFTHLKVIVDKTDGYVQQLIDAKGCIPPEKQREIVSENLDAFLNQVYRAAKCRRDGDKIAAQFEAAEALSPLLVAIFALHGRVKPYYKYLLWELETYPLDKFSWKTDTFITQMLNVVKQGDTEVLITLLQKIRPVFRQEGYGHVIDGWKGYYVVGEESG